MKRREESTTTQTQCRKWASRFKDWKFTEDTVSLGTTHSHTHVGEGPGAHYSENEFQMLESLLEEKLALEVHTCSNMGTSLLKMNVFAEQGTYMGIPKCTCNIKGTFEGYIHKCHVLRN